MTAIDREPATRDSIGEDAVDDRVERLRERVAALEADRWRILDDAQREADTVFAQYQLSQLLAAIDSVPAMARAVLEELARNTDATSGGLWLATAGDRAMELVARHRAEEAATGGRANTTDDVPRRFRSAEAALRWARNAGWFAVALDQSRDSGSRRLERESIGLVALSAGPDGRLSSDHARLLGLVRHELATALRAAQLRETLTRERMVVSAILDGASDAIVAVDAERRVVRLNPAAGALLDTPNPVGASCEVALACRRPHLVAGRGPAGPDALACGDSCPFAEVLAGSPPIVGRERDLPGHDGPVPVAASYARMPGLEGGAVGVLRDLRPSRELDDLKSSFVAAVSHELRTPLALISGYVQTVLRLELDPDRQRHYLEQIDETTGRLTDLVNQILDIARLDSDRMRLERRPTSLAPAVDAALTELNGTAPPDVSVDLGDADVPLDVDPERLRQVLANLLANARKYAGTAARIDIRAAATKPGWLTISVVDDGPGIPADERVLVFERFYRGRGVGQSTIHGSGLGLYLCRRIVEAHGGEIWLDDVPAGTSVSLSLPTAGEVREAAR